MIWHIFRKDWKLLWWKVVLVWALQAAGAWADWRLGHIESLHPGARSAHILGGLAQIATFVGLVEAVLEDPIPGETQDWLARPVSRFDLLIAKLLFAMTVIVSSSLFDLLGNLANGFPLGRSLALFAAGVPMLVISGGAIGIAVASLARRMTEILAALFVGVLGLFVISAATTGIANIPLHGPLTGTGLDWVWNWGSGAIYFAGAIVVLCVQYARRRTLLARSLAVIFLLASTLPAMLPWQTAFAIEEKLSPVPGSADHLTAGFDPGAGRSRGPGHDMDKAYLPIRFSGLPAERWLNIDAVESEVISPLGNKIGSGIASGTTVLPEIDPVTGDLIMREVVPMPHDWAGEPVRLRLKYSLTLFAPEHSYSMPAINGDARLPGLGSCETRAGELGCLTEHVPVMATGFLEDPAHGVRNPDEYLTGPNYEPGHTFDSTRWGSAQRVLPTSRDTARYPIDETNYGETTLRIETWKPLEHFQREITTPLIQLRDWLPER